MATIQKSLSKKADARNYRQVYFRISVNRNLKIRYKTGISVHSECWNEENSSIVDFGRAKLPESVIACGVTKEELSNTKAKLTDLELRIIKLCDFKALSDPENLNKEWLDSAVKHSIEQKVEKINVTDIDRKISATSTQSVSDMQFFDLIFFFRDNVKKKNNKKREGDRSDLWKKNFTVTIRSLQRYECFVNETSNKKFKLKIEDINTETLADFENYLSNEYLYYTRFPEIFKRFPVSTDKRRSPAPQKRGRNTICKKMDYLRAFFNWCREERICEQDPFIGFDGTTSEKYGTPYYITLEERNIIADLDLSNKPQLAIQRDIFIFQCCIGCRVSDLMRLKKQSIVDGEVNYIPGKTKDKELRTVKVPLNSKALRIVERYENIDGEKLLPFISPQKYNESIKQIFTLAGINRMVTVLDSVTGEEVQKPINEVASSHMARRTFIGNLYSKVKDPNLIASMSGHSEGSKSFARYREIDKNLRTETVKLID